MAWSDGQRTGLRTSSAGLPGSSPGGDVPPAHGEPDAEHGAPRQRPEQGGAFGEEEGLRGAEVEGLAEGLGTLEGADDGVGDVAGVVGLVVPGAAVQVAHAARLALV